jgi:hypothetical protein
MTKGDDFHAKHQLEIDFTENFEKLMRRPTKLTTNDCALQRKHTFDVPEPAHISKRCAINLEARIHFQV